MSIDLEHEIRTYAEYLDEVLPTVTADSVRTGIPDRPSPVAAAPPWYRRPAVVFLAAMAGVLSVAVTQLLFLSGPTVTTTPQATGAFVCPAGSTPDQPGPADQPRPPDYGRMTFDPDSGQAFMLTQPGGSFWVFDVCTNIWTAAPQPDGVGVPLDLVYDVDSQRAIRFGLADEDEDVGVVDVGAYEPATQTWTRKSDWAVGPPPEWYFPVFPQPQAVYDPVTGLVVVREPFTSAMWTYDVDTDTWTEIDQGTILPPAVAEDGPHVELLTYDASVDRLILYVASDGAARTVLGTWEFDIRAGRWEEQETNTPARPGFGWWPSGEEFVYDEANRVSVLFASQYLAIYSASENSWTIIPHDSDVVGGTTVSIAYDPVNERILVAGGFAFDVATREWITLLEPTAE